MHAHKRLVTLIALLFSGCVFAVDHPVTISGFSFVPGTLSINVGDTVTFSYAGGGAPHNVVADDSSFRCAHGCDGDGMGGDGNLSSTAWSFTRTYSGVGTFGYYCEAHGQAGVGMFGTISVTTPVSLQSFDVE